jgi:hypothetical protein
MASWKAVHDASRGGRVIGFKKSIFTAVFASTAGARFAASKKMGLESRLQPGGGRDL